MKSGPQEPDSDTRIVIPQAQYRDTGVDFYRGNPLIEALPPINSTEDAISLLRRRPNYREEYRNLPVHLRFHYLQRLLEVFVVLPQHVMLEQKIATLIRSGYRARNPLSPQFVRDASRTLATFSHSAGEGGAGAPLAQGSDLIGISGIGKSSALRRILQLYEPALEHSEYNGRPLSFFQAVWLHLECPSNGGIKALCIEFFQKVDRLLGTKYLARFGAGNNDTMMLNMARVATWQSLGLLVIDEVQNASIAKSGGDLQFMNHVVRLRNEIGLPVILVGTPEAEPVLAGKFRNARRGTGWGVTSWNRFSESDDEWELFLSRIWRYQYTASSTALTDELRAAIYDESQGITDLAVKVYLLSQAHVMLSNDVDPTETITPEVVRKAAREGLALCQPYLQALRRGDQAALLLMHDIHASIDSRIEQIQGVLERRRLLHSLDADRRSTEVSEEKVDGVIAWLVEAGCAPQEATRVARQAARTLGHETDEAALRLAAMRLWTGQRSQRRGARKQKGSDNSLGPDSLISLVKQGRSDGKCGYEALKAAGIAKSLPPLSGDQVSET